MCRIAVFGKMGVVTSNGSVNGRELHQIDWPDFDPKIHKVAGETQNVYLRAERVRKAHRHDLGWFQAQQVSDKLEPVSKRPHGLDMAFFLEHAHEPVAAIKVLCVKRTGGAEEMFYIEAHRGKLTDHYLIPARYCDELDTRGSLKSPRSDENERASALA